MYTSCIAAWLFILACFTGSQSSDDNGFVRYCYYTAGGDLSPEQIVASWCTHVTYGFGVMQNDTLTPRRPGDLQIYKELVALKNRSPNLKLVLSVGSVFPSVVDRPEEYISGFAANATSFLRKHGFDGIDFDWEFPKITERWRYMTFLKLFRAYVQKEAVHTNKTQITMSAALPGSKLLLEESYEISEISQYLDFVGIMTYDFHIYGPILNAVTGYNSPLYTAKEEFPTFSLSALIEYVLKKGVTPSKLVVGIPFYGRTFVLKSAANHGLHARAVGTTGSMGYAAACNLTKHGGVRVWDDYSQVPYIYNDTLWLSYDDTQSVALKCEWVKKMKLRGVLIWAIELDDTIGICDPKGEKYSLIRTVASVLP